MPLANDNDAGPNGSSDCTIIPNCARLAGCDVLLRYGVDLRGINDRMALFGRVRLEVRMGLKVSDDTRIRTSTLEVREVTGELSGSVGRDETRTHGLRLPLSLIPKEEKEP